ncbi:MAG TPA: hypothetical protein VLW47_04505, partial [Thermodesulfobacteriota bacterium]|nr:hypothetical protein [Thermodesulfobacteriota bacterium]
IKPYLPEIDAKANVRVGWVYSEKVIERWLNPRNRGKVRNADGFSMIKGPCGGTDILQGRRREPFKSKIQDGWMCLQHSRRQYGNRIGSREEA